MQKVLGDFIYALRQAGLPISSAETLDALKAAQLVGIDNAPLLKQSLGMTLSKRLEHRLIHDQIFDQYFNGYGHLQEEGGKPLSQEAYEKAENAESEAVNSEAASEQTAASASSSGENQGNNQIPETAANLTSPLAQQLMAGDMSALQVMIAGAGAGAGAQEVTFSTQVPIVTYRVMQAMGDSGLQQELQELAKEDENNALAQLLRQRRSQLQQQVRDYVEQQYLLFNQGESQKLRESNLQKIRLTSVDHSNYKLMGELVRKAAKRLASMHSRRRRITKRGMLDVRRTVSANAAFDGFLFHTKWKSTRIERPKVMVICDVSGSVSSVARFLLLFLYCLQDVLPKVRSFVFSAEMAEVTELFAKKEMDEALAEILHRWANSPTHYGKALADFEQLALADIDNKTTVIMLGDARNNGSDGNIAVWEEVYRRSQRVLWLNPEGQTSWDTGDSIMSQYAPYCSLMETCNSLRDLNRILGSELKRSG
ncbi:MAG: VWA containing CoxE family protein [Oceanospirillum sp.]|nr:VWA containing CoxE family protein [Oceanospirillum sp.]